MDIMVGTMKIYDGEGVMKEVSEADMLEVIKFAHAEIKSTAWQKELEKEVERDCSNIATRWTKQLKGRMEYCYDRLTQFKSSDKHKYRPI